MVETPSSRQQPGSRQLYLGAAIAAPAAVILWIVLVGFILWRA